MTYLNKIRIWSRDHEEFHWLVMDDNDRFRAKIRGLMADARDRWQQPVFVELAETGVDAGQKPE